MSGILNAIGGSISSAFAWLKGGKSMVNPVATWVGVGVTFAAVLVALLKDEFWRLARRPALQASIELKSPDCQKTQMSVSNLLTGQVKSWPCYYFRIWVKNTGKSRAEKVQVFMSRLLRQCADKSFHEEEHFDPMNLKWAHDHLLFADAISPKMGKHCDFFHINSPQMRSDGAAPYTLSTVPAAETIIEFDTEVVPNNFGNLIGQGTYRVELVIAGANVGPISKTFEIVLSGKWYDDGKQMFADGVGVTRV